MTRILDCFVVTMIAGLFQAAAPLPISQLQKLTGLLPPIGSAGVKNDYAVLEEDLIISARAIQSEQANK